jgi:hypothetical protein
MTLVRSLSSDPEVRKAVDETAKRPRGRKKTSAADLCPSLVKRETKPLPPGRGFARFSGSMASTP